MTVNHCGVFVRKQILLLAVLSSCASGTNTNTPSMYEFDRFLHVAPLIDWSIWSIMSLNSLLDIFSSVCRKADLLSGQPIVVSPLASPRPISTLRTLLQSDGCHMTTTETPWSKLCSFSFWLDCDSSMSTWRDAGLNPSRAEKTDRRRVPQDSGLTSRVLLVKHWLTFWLFAHSLVI